jgi:hypothetical protein
MYCTFSRKSGELSVVFVRKKTKKGHDDTVQMIYGQHADQQ